MTARFITALLFIAPPLSAATVDDAVHARLARDGTVRVFIEFAAESGVRGRAQRPGLQAIHVLQTIPAMVATVTADGLAQLTADPTVVTIAADRAGSGGLSASVPQIRADRVRNRGITGAGTVVAVLDSGIDASHPDVAGAIVGEECFCVGGCCPGGVSRATGLGSAAGIHPHGVHVTWIVASRGHVAPVGVAPAAGILAVRVLDDDNRGFLSDWLAALDWVAANRPDVRVVNMSLVSDDLFTPPCDDKDAFTRGFAQVHFLLSACFNQNDPLLPDCRFDETLTRFVLTSPDPMAPPTSQERVNADNLLQSLPGFPLPDGNACGVSFPLVVTASDAAMIRASASTATRRDYDRVSFRCRARL